MRVLADPLVICVDRGEHLGSHVFGIRSVTGIDPLQRGKLRGRIPHGGDDNGNQPFAELNRTFVLAPALSRR
jgi:hypothetical protein